MSFTETLGALGRIKELLAKETELRAIKQAMKEIKPYAGMESKYMYDFDKTENAEDKKLVKFNDVKRGTSSFIFNFRRVTNHSHINTDGVVFARISDERFELSHATVVRLDMVGGVVVAQSVTLRGVYFPHDFVGMTTLELMEWSADSNELESRQLANGKEDVSKKFAVVGD